MIMQFQVMYTQLKLILIITNICIANIGYRPIFNGESTILETTYLELTKFI